MTRTNLNGRTGLSSDKTLKEPVGVRGFEVAFEVALDMQRLAMSEKVARLRGSREAK